MDPRATPRRRSPPPRTSCSSAGAELPPARGRARGPALVRSRPRRTGSPGWPTDIAGPARAGAPDLPAGLSPGLRRARSVHTALALSTLSGEESLSVAGGLLGVDELPAALQSLVLDKAEGNPFFIEELVRSLEEQGAVRRDGRPGVVLTAGLDRVAVPDTVEDVILDRTHRLDDAAPARARRRGRHRPDGAAALAARRHRRGRGRRRRRSAPPARPRSSSTRRVPSPRSSTASSTRSRRTWPTAASRRRSGAPCTRASWGRSRRSTVGPARRARRAARLSRDAWRAVAGRRPLRPAGGGEGLRSLGEPRGGGLLRGGARRPGAAARQRRHARRGDRHPPGRAQRARSSWPSCGAIERYLREAEALATAPRRPAPARRGCGRT